MGLPRMKKREYQMQTHSTIVVYRIRYWFFGSRMGLRFDCPHCEKKELKHLNLANHMEKHHNATWAEADAQIRQAEEEWRQSNPGVSEE
jgi:hypothetical protein